MSQTTTLCSLACGQSAYISRIGRDCPIGVRLADLGFTAGARVCALQSDGARSLRAYEVCGAVIALRHEDAKYVEVHV